MPNFLKGRGFNFALAALLAASVAFAFLAMPDDMFGSIVEMTGIPAFIPAAAPPLGFTARLAVVAAATLAGFLLVWFLLRSLDAPAPRSVERVRDDDLAEASWLAPRVRRADAHPDAPAPRPILADQEFGEPIELEGSPGAETVVDAGPPAAMAEPPADDPWAKTLDLEIPAPQWLDAAEEPVEASSEAGTASAVRAEEPVNEASTESLMARLPLPEDGGESVSSLLQRLDAGLANCEWPLQPAASQAPHPSSPPGGDDRLRSVLDDLQKLAARS